MFRTKLHCLLRGHSIPRITRITRFQSFPSYANRFLSVSPIRKDLFESIYTIPNALTLSRIAISPVIGYLIVNHSFTLGLSLLVIAGLTDALDGWIARRFKMSSALGSVLDPMADKILMTTLVVSLTNAGSLSSRFKDV